MIIVNMQPNARRAGGGAGGHPYTILDGLPSGTYLEIYRTLVEGQEL